MNDRIDLLGVVGDWLSSRKDLHPIDAVVFPGGYGFLPQVERVPLLQYNDPRVFSFPFAREARNLARRIPGLQVIAGLDTETHKAGSAIIGGQQLAVAFNHEGVSGFARKIFPVGEDVDGKTMPPMLLHASDYDSKSRIIPLANGSKAVLCVCYDMFGLGDAARGETDRLNKAVYVMDRNNNFVTDREAQQAVLQQCFQRWNGMLAQAQPDVALGTIHRFEKPGREIFWQRHGIATASAGLKRLSMKPGFAVAAAHVGTLPDDPDVMNLASLDVPVGHLNAGSNRPMHTRKATRHQGFFVQNGQARAVLKLFET